MVGLAVHHVSITVAKSSVDSVKILFMVYIYKDINYLFDFSLG